MKFIANKSASNTIFSQKNYLFETCIWTKILHMLGCLKRLSIEGCVMNAIRTISFKHNLGSNHDHRYHGNSAEPARPISSDLIRESQTNRVYECVGCTSKFTWFLSARLDTFGFPHTPIVCYEKIVSYYIEISYVCGTSKTKS
jgi:hypothetical protein